MTLTLRPMALRRKSSNRRRISWSGRGDGARSLGWRERWRVDGWLL